MCKNMSRRDRFSITPDKRLKGVQSGVETKIRDLPRRGKYVLWNNIRYRRESDPRATVPKNNRK